MDYQNYKLCERCNCQPVLLNCTFCSPFNNFCSKCDTDIHTLPSKINHKRTQLHPNNHQPLPSQIPKPQYNQDSNIDTQQQQPQTSNIPTTDNPLFYYPSANLSYLETKQSDQRTSFTKDYVNELKAIHQKEKSELLFKITSLQSAFDRLKASFGEHINKMQISIDENNKQNSNKMKQYEEENDFRIKKLLSDKDNLIARLKKDNEELHKNNVIACQSLEENDKEVNQIKDTYDNKVASLANELSNRHDEIEELRQNNKVACEALAKESKEKILSMTSEHEAKLNELHAHYNDQLNTIKRDYDTTSRELFITKEKMNEDKKEYDMRMNMLQEDNTKLGKEIQYIEGENSSLFNRVKDAEANLANANSENELAVKVIERQKSDILRREEDIIFLENSIKALRNEIELLKDKSSRMQNDYTRMCSHADSMTYEYETKIKSLTYVEEKNFSLERENNELRSRIERIIRPYTFNK